MSLTAIVQERDRLVMNCVRAPKQVRLCFAVFSLWFGTQVVPVETVAAQVLDFRNPDNAPPSWIQFGKLVKYRFEEWIAADDAVASRFRVYLKAHVGTSDGPPSLLAVRAWLNPDGSVERVAFTAFSDAGATQDLRTILTRGNVGEAPPPEMLQPINLRFSLNLKK